jgi:hypothetical protein
MIKIIHYCYAILLLVACNARPTQQSEILALRHLGDIATTEYVVSKIIKASDDQTWYKIGDRKILISCEATIKAGIDLTQLQQKDVQIEGKHVTIHLPTPKIISLSMPPEKIKVEHVEIGILRKDFDNAERDALLAQGEQQIRNSIPALGILETTQKNSSLFISNFLQRLGYEQVTILYEPKPSPKNNRP